MHVDGFRFDLAPSLARGTSGDVDHFSSFFAVVHQDPVLSRIKLIAEPWDVGEGGYQAGNFPILWNEWNGRFRDTVRSFARGERRVVGDLGYRLTGSSDLFEDDGRHPHASVNFVTAHDGFTLRDLVSYERKHNEANGENNSDGVDENLSQNCGVEGDSKDERILAKRRTVARSMLATLFVSQGVPMLEMGDELWRTQRGNNNPYCHDSELTWVDWRMTGDARAMLVATRALAELRKRHPVFRRRQFLRGDLVPGGKCKDIVWLTRDGTEMTAEHWANPPTATIAFRLDGAAVDSAPAASEAAPNDDSFLVLMNGERETMRFALPPAALGKAWQVVVEPSEGLRVGDRFEAGAGIAVAAGNVILLVDVSREAPAASVATPQRP
jgi:isoamylase